MNVQNIRKNDKPVPKRYPGVPEESQNVNADACSYRIEQAKHKILGGLK